MAGKPLIMVIIIEIIVTMVGAEPSPAVDDEEGGCWGQTGPPLLGGGGQLGGVTMLGLHSLWGHCIRPSPQAAGLQGRPVL